MNYLLSLKDAAHDSPYAMGNKALSLARLTEHDFLVPDGYCLPVHVYKSFLDQTGLESFINMELRRKDFKKMRWEEVWDTSLRIRNHFLTRPWPEELRSNLIADLENGPCLWRFVAVRSSAPGEDSANFSFAGLHESRIMVSGVEAILNSIRIVWASLWSDGALLYRQELGLDPNESSMAILFQQMILGDFSGILFSQGPQDLNHMTIESVWGLNQSLVDGSLEPDRVQVNRHDGSLAIQNRVNHELALQLDGQNVSLMPLTKDKVGQSPLTPEYCNQLYELAKKVEDFFRCPVDVEWTVQNNKLFLLQARPITSKNLSDPEDERPWYLSLHRSLENLESLRFDIEHHVLPGMEKDALAMSRQTLTNLSDTQLVKEFHDRCQVLGKWLDAYKEKCIPMAHGIRLFGQFYNDYLRPSDPYEFLDLLRNEDLLAIRRNQDILTIVEELRHDRKLFERLKQGQPIPPESVVAKKISSFKEEFSGIQWVFQDGYDFLQWLMKLAEGPYDMLLMPKIAGCKRSFLEEIPNASQNLARQLLDLARSSYKLRDNDNIYLGKVRACVVSAANEIRKRLEKNHDEFLQKALEENNYKDGLFESRGKQHESTQPNMPVNAKARQLIGQPAGPGVNSGQARIIGKGADFKDFQRGEVLVCSAIEPNMTFVIPLASAIIEQRGGMLIHGAIIAREYGIPCVTGIDQATHLIKSGDKLTVDGYLGIVTVDCSD